MGPTDHVQLELSTNFLNLATRYRGKNRLTEEIISTVTLSGARSQADLARVNLQRLVYDTPQGDWPRTRRLYDSVKEERINSTSHEAKVDPQDYNGFVYALTIENGSSNWMWWGRPASRGFAARPFWRPAKQLSEQTARLDARAALRLIRAEYLR